ncbi:hypothetical protein Tco_0529457 [Tanacetum coccineum]
MREEANTARNLVGQLNALIAEMEALEDQGELFDTLMDLRDDREAVRTKLQGNWLWCLSSNMRWSEVNVDSNDSWCQFVGTSRLKQTRELMAGRYAMPLETLLYSKDLKASS